MRNNQDKKYKTDLICPITNSPLWYIGTEHWVMDPVSFYSPESDSNIIFARHSFRYNLFRQVTDKTTCSTELRIFRLNDDKSWVEVKPLPLPSAKIFYMDYTYSPNWFIKLIRKIKNKFKNKKS